ncbi:MAG: hypothetical protein M3209_04965 [Acidobacteriota bacterium]|nr:hypothetical protein [Acidobacteriota bacterium]
MNRANNALSSKSEDIIPERIDVPAAAQVSTEQITADQELRGSYKRTRELLRERRIKSKKVRPNRKDLPDGPGETFNSHHYPLPEAKFDHELAAAPQAPAQTLGIQFDGVTGPNETGGAFPPDTEGEVGPTQFVVFVNGRLRTFNKTTGVADGVMNVDTDVFFASVLTTPSASQYSFTTDPNVRYDRLTNRWFLNMIDVTLVSATGALAVPNRNIIAVSDAASNGNITPATVWTFYQFQGDPTLFTDYQSFGIDASAMYIGANMFTLAGAFASTKGFVIPKAPALAGSPLTVWSFSGLVATASGAGPFSPRGVDNPDPTNIGATAIGYFIGVDNATFNTLMLRRITNPGSLGPAPTISANISIPAPLTTRYPVLVPHLGNTGGANGRLDALDDRLYSAMIRNGRLWTAHNIGVNNTGVAGTTNNRNAARWYEIQNLNAAPSIAQSGTVFDNNATNDVNQRNYWIPTIAVSGQGHAAMGMSIAGTNERINAFTTGRLVGDALGTMREGPGGTAFPGYTSSSTAYNPADDPGGSGGRRWGDYSATVVDPLDDMTMWTLQEYNNGANTYGVRAVKLIAPPPATPASISPANIPVGQTSTNVTITGTSVNGSGFYDPGANLPAPALPFNHIAVSISGGNVIVNSVTYNSPTSITLNLNTVGALPGLRNVTVTNPDGQTGIGNNILNLTCPTPSARCNAGTVTYGTSLVTKRVSGVLISAVGASSANATTGSTGAYLLDNLTSGGNYTITPSKTGNVNGITAFDATLILRHVAAGGVGPNALTANQQLAANTDGITGVTAFDATLILRYVSANGANANTGQTGNWSFSPNQLTYNPLPNSMISQNFTAILLGEVDGDWVAPN